MDAVMVGFRTEIPRTRASRRDVTGCRQRECVGARLRGRSGSVGRLVYGLMEREANLTAPASR